MTATDRVEIDILVKTQQAILGLGQFVVGVKAAIMAVKGIYSVINDLVQAAGKQEAANMKLAAGIRAVGKEGLISAEGLIDYAQQLQKITIYSDDATTEAMGLLIQIGNLSEQGVRKLIPLVQDMASAMGMDLNSAALLVAKSIGSETNALARYGITLKDTASPSGRLAELTKALTERFGGMAEAMGETTLGRLQRLRNEFDELKKQLGNELLPTVNKVMEALVGIAKGVGSYAAAKKILSTEGFQEAISSLQNAKDAMEALKAEMDRTNEMMQKQGRYVATETARLKQLQNAYNMIVQVLPLLETQHKAEQAALAASSAQKERAAKAAELLNQRYRESWDNIDAVWRMAEKLRREEEIAAKVKEELIDLTARQNKELLQGIDYTGKYGETTEAATDLTDRFNKMLLQGVDYAGRYEEQIDELAKTLEKFEKQAATAVEAIRPFSDAIALMVSDTEAGMEALKEAIKDAVAKILEILAKEAFVRALMSLSNPVAAAAWAAAGVAAMIAAGVVRAMKEGGLVTKPTLALLGEAGPEMVTPLSRAGTTGVTIIVQGSVIEERNLARTITAAIARQSRGY